MSTVEKSNNILMITRSFYPLKGGVEKHVQMVSEVLSHRGFAVTIYTSYINNLISKQRKEYTDKNNITIVEIKYLHYRFLGLFVIWSRLFLRINEVRKFDIVHVHDVFVWFMPLKLFLPQKKMYSTFHGWEGIYPIPLKNKLIRRISARLSTSYFIVGKYIEKFYGIQKGVTIHGAVQTINKVSRKRKKKMVYLGRLAKDTGLPMILKSLDMIDFSFDMEFCGDGPLKQECRRYGKVHGFVNPEKYTKDANIIFPGGYLSILESFANKSNVVVTYSNPLKKEYFLNTPFKNWISAASNTTELKLEIEKIVNDPMNNKTKLDKACKWSREQSWERLVDKYLKLWGEI